MKGILKLDLSPCKWSYYWTGWNLFWWRAKLRLHQVWSLHVTMFQCTNLTFHLFLPTFLFARVGPVLDGAPESGVALGPAHVGEDDVLHRVEALEVGTPWKKKCTFMSLSTSYWGASIPLTGFRYVIIEISICVMFPLYRTEFLSKINRNLVNGIDVPQVHLFVTLERPLLIIIAALVSVWSENNLKISYGH